MFNNKHNGLPIKNKSELRFITLGAEYRDTNGN